MNYGIIVAAGKGERFGGEKQFSSLLGKPLLYYPLLAFQRCKIVDSIVLVVSKERVSYAQELVRGFNKVKKVAEGGETRQDSVRRGLEELGPSGFVAIHDGARPFLTPKLIEKGFHALRNHKAVTYGIPIYETVKRIRGGKVGEVIDRDGLFIIQTPQFFSLSIIKEAHKRAYAEGYYTSDDTSLTQWIGEDVHLLIGDPRNIKVTTQEDLKLIEKLLS